MRFVLEHIGIVVKDIDVARKHYETVYGSRPLLDVVYEPAHQVYVQFLDVGHGSKPTIELISPSEHDSRVSNFLKKTGGGLHHLAYEVENIGEAIAHFMSHRSMILGDIVHGAGHQTPTVWLYTAEKQLIELIEAANE